MKSHLIRMFEQVHWANEQILRHLQRVDCPSDKPPRLLAHVYGAEQIWVRRLLGEDTTGLAVWPEGGLAYCEEAFKVNRARYDAFFEQLPDDGLLRMVNYSNSSGTAFSTSVADILTHVSFHGSYHRGQINTILRSEGCDVVSTDYITFARLM